MRKHKVGTLTLGVMLLFYGVLFLVHLFTNALSYSLIFRLWPVMFILLGVEVLLSILPKTEEHFKIDVGAVVLLIVLILFAMAMAGVDMGMNWSWEMYQARVW